MVILGCDVGGYRIRFERPVFVIAHPAHCFSHPHLGCHPYQFHKSPFLIQSTWKNPFQPHVSVHNGLPQPWAHRRRSSSEYLKGSGRESHLEGLLRRILLFPEYGKGLKNWNINNFLGQRFLTLQMLPPFNTMTPQPQNYFLWYFIIVMLLLL